jgi:hypothetical protein
MNWKPRIGGGFSDRLDIVQQFQVELEQYTDFPIAVAYYDNEGYDGDAYVLFWEYEPIRDTVLAMV